MNGRPWEEIRREILAREPECPGCRAIVRRHVAERDAQGDVVAEAEGITREAAGDAP